MLQTSMLSGERPLLHSAALLHASGLEPFDAPIVRRAHLPSTDPTSPPGPADVPDIAPVKEPPIDEPPMSDPPAIEEPDPADPTKRVSSRYRFGRAAVATN